MLKGQTKRDIAFSGLPILFNFLEGGEFDYKIPVLATVQLALKMQQEDGRDRGFDTFMKYYRKANAYFERYYSEIPEEWAVRFALLRQEDFQWAEIYKQCCKKMADVKTVADEGIYAFLMFEFPAEVKKCLLVEPEKFMPVIKKLVDDHPDVHFTFWLGDNYHRYVLMVLFRDYQNVQMEFRPIYAQGSIVHKEEEKFDFVLGMPYFGKINTSLPDGTGQKVSRSGYELAAENLAGNLQVDGTVLMFLPAKFLYGSAEGELRQYLAKNYWLEEFCLLPEGFVLGTASKILSAKFVNRQELNDEVQFTTFGVNEHAAGSISQSQLQKMPVWNEILSGPEKNETENWDLLSRGACYRLGDVAEIFRGKAIRDKDEQGEYGIITIANIDDYGFVWGGGTMEHCNAPLRKVINYLVQEGDVLVATRGMRIRTAVFEHSYGKHYIASSNVIVIRPNREKLDSKYLWYFLNSEEGNRNIRAVQSGGKVMNLGYHSLAALRIPKVDLALQKKAGEDYQQACYNYLKGLDKITERFGVEEGNIQQMLKEELWKKQEESND